MARTEISKERLNQIARRKLEALGIAIGLARDGKTLLGLIPIKKGAMINPANGEAIDEIRFAVEGHDHLRLLAPPSLRELSPQAFYGFDRASLLLTRIAEQLARRFSAAREHEARMRARQIPARIDPVRILAQGQLDLGPTGKVLLEGSDRGLFATHAKRPGQDKPLLLGEVPIDLDEFPDRVDLELAVSRWVDEAEHHPPAEAASTPDPQPALATGTLPVARSPALSATGAEGPPPTLRAVAPALTQVQGSAAGAPGLGVRLAAITGRIDADLRLLSFKGVKALVVGKDRLRFSIEQRGEVFIGKLQKPGEVLWEEPIDLITFPGVEALVSRITGIELRPPGDARTPAAARSAPDASRATTQVELPAMQPDAAGTAAQGPVPAHALPIAGECWVMDVRVVGQEGGEVRYAPVNANGQTYGAPRVLPQANFRDAFSDLGGGSFRLSVEVLAVEAQSILYMQLDANRGRVGDQRGIPPAIFVSTFLPEAAAY